MDPVSLGKWPIMTPVEHRLLIHEDPQAVPRGSVRCQHPLRELRAVARTEQCQQIPQSGPLLKGQALLSSPCQISEHASVSNLYLHLLRPHPPSAPC